MYDAHALILLAKEPVIKCNTDYKTNQRFETTCFRCFHKSLMAQALPAIDNINVLIVPPKQEHWVGLDTHVHTHSEAKTGMTWNQKTLVWLSLEFQHSPREKGDIPNSWWDPPFKVLYTVHLESLSARYICPKKVHEHTHVQSCFSHSRQKVETTQVSLGTDKLNEMQPYNGILFSHEKD